MARIAGVDLPRDKRVEIALTYIFGVGMTTSKQILAKTQVNPDIRVRELSEGDVAKLNETAVPYIMAVYFRYETPTGSELLQSGIQKMMAGSMTPAELGASITQGVARYFKPFQK